MLGLPRTRATRGGTTGRDLPTAAAKFALLDTVPESSTGRLVLILYNRGVGVVMEVEYPSAGALRVEVETQLGLGGLVLEVAAPEAIVVGASIVLRLLAPGADGMQRFELAAVVAERSADSLCLEIEEREADALRAQSFIANAEPKAVAAPVVRFIVADVADDHVADGPKPRDAAKADRIEPIERRLAGMSVGEKVKMALHGTREWRTFLARDRAGVIQAALVRNPRVSIDEMTALARGPVLAPDAAEALAQHAGFGSSPMIALALVRNPRTPLPTAINMVARLTPTDLRAVAKGVGVRAQVASAARKKLINER